MLRAWHCLRALPALFFCAVALAQAPAAPPAAGPRFDIFEFVVSGDTLLGAAAIERAVYPFLGPQRTVADAEAARAALERAYQEAGYLSVAVVLPEQRVDNANAEVRLVVVPAVVEKLRITGSTFHLPSLVEAGLPSVAPGRVPDFNQLQTELAELARINPDRELTPVLAAGKAPATLAVEMKVEDRLPLHGALELNNKQSPGTVAGRAEASLSYDNLFQRGHSLGLAWFVAPRRIEDANVLSLSYGVPRAGGDRLSLFVTHSDSNTPVAIGGATTSRGETARLRWRDELPGLADLRHALTWGLTARESRDRSTAADGTLTPAPPLRYTTLAAAYELTLSHGPGAETSASLEWTVSPRGLNRRNVDCFGTVSEQFACKRADASPQFQVLGFNARHRQPIGGFGLVVQLQGQFSDSPLVSAEQVVYGGQDSVRGYLEGEQAGDLGAALRVQFDSPVWVPREGIRVRGLVFHDAAVVRRLYASAEESASQRLRSAGLGLRIDAAFGLQVRLDWAHLFEPTVRLVGGVRQPLSGKPAGESDRWELSVRQSF
jgi:hemolysin activation/secretion protein